MRFPLRLTGLVAAPHTPFHANGQLNPKQVARQAHLFDEAGVAGVFVCGTTGESLSLTTAERREIAERWVECYQGRKPVVVHIGSNSMPEAQQLARHAQEIGADAIAAMAPTFFKPSRLDDLIDFCAAIAAAAPLLPFYFYDIPSMTGVTIPTARFLSQASARIPTLHGIKFTNGDLMLLQECLALGSFDIVFGCDELLLAGLALGVRGAVGSTYNFAAPLHQKIIEAMKIGDFAEARRWQLQSVQMIRVLQEFGFSRASKAMMSLLGVDCGPVRSPLRAMATEEIANLFDRMKGWDGWSRPLRSAASAM
jgi:N-acetylneuraminate lyase